MQEHLEYANIYYLTLSKIFYRKTISVIDM